VLVHVEILKLALLGRRKTSDMLLLLLRCFLAAALAANLTLLLAGACAAQSVQAILDRAKLMLFYRQVLLR